ncbi:hypothetical protein P20652_3376 [Pseudoalteromonas sp. BSi20652]|nr:hypothetical protein P20652_3376 [Pseudoalteromonas sp. BSi20652]
MHKNKVAGWVLKISHPAFNHFSPASALKIRNCVDILALNLKRNTPSITWREGGLIDET